MFHIVICVRAKSNPQMFCRVKILLVTHIKYTAELAVIEMNTLTELVASVNEDVSTIPFLGWIHTIFGPLTFVQMMTQLFFYVLTFLFHLTLLETGSKFTAFY